MEEILRQLEPDEIASVDLKKLKGQIALIEGVSAPRRVLTNYDG